MKYYAYMLNRAIANAGGMTGPRSEDQRKAMFAAMRRGGGGGGGGGGSGGGSSGGGGGSSSGGNPRPSPSSGGRGAITKEQAQERAQRNSPEAKAKAERARRADELGMADQEKRMIAAGKMDPRLAQFDHIDPPPDVVKVNGKWTIPIPSSDDIARSIDTAMNATVLGLDGQPVSMSLSDQLKAGIAFVGTSGGDPEKIRPQQQTQFVPGRIEDFHPRTDEQRPWSQPPPKQPPGPNRPDDWGFVTRALPALNTKSFTGSNPNGIRPRL